MPNRAQWQQDQIAKSIFFKQKLHEWRLIEIAEEIEQIPSETLSWDSVGISALAWNKVIHSAIRPVLIFAHPHVLQSIQGAVGYYRMLAMVSQKSMRNVGYPVADYESHQAISDVQIATGIAQHLNTIISLLIEANQQLNPREFDLWRGMAAGTQAQGAWQNAKGLSAEQTVRTLILSHLQQRGVIGQTEQPPARVALGNGREMVFAQEPDIAVYEHGIPNVVVEIKGGIDPAGALERVGAALKSLQRAKRENPLAITILIVESGTMTDRAREDLSISTETVTHTFIVSELLQNRAQRNRFLGLLID